MDPLLRQATGHGVIRDAVDHLERIARAMASGHAWSGIGNQLSVLIIEMRSRLFVAAAPAAHADHQVVLPPVRKGIIGGVDRYQAAAVADVLFERGLYTIRPAIVGSVVIRDNHLVFAPFGFERAEIAATWRRGDHIHLKNARVVQHPFQIGGGLLPGMVSARLLSVEQHDVDRSGSGARYGARKGRYQ